MLMTDSHLEDPLLDFDCFGVTNLNVMRKSLCNSDKFYFIFLNSFQLYILTIELTLTILSLGLV